MWVAGACQTKFTKKSHIVKYRRGPLLACGFEDKKHDIVLSTYGNGNAVEYTSRRNRKRATTGCVRQYNQYMGGIDMRIYFFQEERRTKR